MNQLHFDMMLERLQDVFTYEIFSLSGNPVTLLSTIIFFGVLVGSWFLSKYLQVLYDQKINTKFDGGTDYTIKRLIHYTTIAIGFFIAIDFIGFDLTSLAVIAGFLSVGIGFGMQNIASNFISGLILMIERPVHIGDMVTVDEYFGTVRDIGMRATIVKTLDNIEIVIPNSSFVEENVINWTRGERKIRIKCPVGVSYGTNVKAVEKTLLDIAKNEDSVLSSPEPTVLFDEFGGSSLNFELRVWIKDPTNRIAVRNKINHEIHARFAEEGFEMPFPQRDLHIRSTVPLSGQTDGDSSE